MKNEADVKKAIRKILKDRGAYACAPISGGFGSSGVPDILACYRGKFLGIEVKFGKNKTTALQEKNLKMIDHAGGFGIVLNETNYEILNSALDLVDSLDKLVSKAK